MPPSASSTTTVLLLLLLLTTTTTTTTATTTPIPGLDTYLSHQSHLDPHATNDSFLSLPPSLKKSLSSLSLQPLSLITSLLSFSLPFSLHARLVGPTFPPDAVSLLSSFLSTAHSSDHFHVITPDPSSNYRISVEHLPHFDISHAGPALCSRLSDTIKSAVSAAAPSSLRSSLISIPYDSVDGVIREDFEKEKPVQGVYIYLISVGPGSRSYAYSYSPGDSSSGDTKCLGTIWAGKERYLWIDLSAGPVDYGPGLSGDGVLP